MKKMEYKIRQLIDESLHLLLNPEGEYYLECMETTMNIISEEFHKNKLQEKIIPCCEEPDISWNHNHTKWVCIYCGTKGKENEKV